MKSQSGKYRGSYMNHLGGADMEDTTFGNLEMRGVICKWDFTICPSKLLASLQVSEADTGWSISQETTNRQMGFQMWHTVATTFIHWGIQWSSQLSMHGRATLGIIRSYLSKSTNISLKGEQRRSARISEMDAQKAKQAKSQNKDKRTCEEAMEDLGTEEVDIDLKRGRKKTKIRSIQDLVVDTDGDKIQKVDNSSHEDDQPNSAVMSTETALPERRNLELLLGVLKRRDWYNIFAEPVNPDEVEDYYETIKNPMDFGTISTKLSGGSYKTLAEFEHDVFLVSSNAMLFNSSSTVYYRHARAIKDLAQKLFDALKTNPKNFERECSILRQRAGRRTKNGSCDQPTKRVVSEGSREERPYQHSEDRLGNCKPWETFLNENEAIISSVYKSPESINPKLKTKMDEVGYEGSLMRFVKDLGPTPQTFARDKLQKWKADEAFKHQIATAHLEPRTRRYEIPNVTSGHNGFPAALSLDFHKNSTRSQNFGRKVNILCDKLDARKASTLGILNINNTLRGGFVQAGNKMENIGVYGGKLVQGIGDGVISFKQSMADQGIGTPYLSTIWNNSGNLIPNPINKGKNVLKAEPSSSVFKEIPGNNRKLVPLIKEGYNSCKGNPSYEDIGKYFSTSPAGNSVPSLSTTRDTHNIWEKVFLTPINPSKNFQMSEVTSSYPLQNPGDLQRNPFQPVREEGNAFTQNLPDQGVENSYLYPSLLGAGNSYFSNAENTLYNTNNFVPSAINMGVNVQIPRALREPAAVFKELTPNQGIGGNYFSTPLLLDGNSCFPVQPNSASNPGIFVPTIINNGAMNVQIPGMTSSGPSMLDTLLARDRSILPSATMEVLFPAVTAGSDLTSLIGGVNQIQVVGAGGGTSNEGKLEQADQTLSWLQPTQWAAPQPIFNVSMQEQSGMAAADLAVQAASSDWQALGNNTATNTANGQLMADTSVMNWRHSIDGHLEESNTGAPLFNNHKQTER